jgi:hypothetical protein
MVKTQIVGIAEVAPAALPEAASKSSVEGVYADALARGVCGRPSSERLGSPCPVGYVKGFVGQRVAASWEACPGWGSMGFASRFSGGVLDAGFVGGVVVLFWIGMRCILEGDFLNKLTRVV